MYKDKDGFECDDLDDVYVVREYNVICPCCGDIKDAEDEIRLTEDSPVELECLVCGCVFEAEVEVLY